jgi:hypothetical protein
LWITSSARWLRFWIPHLRDPRYGDGLPAAQQLREFSDAIRAVGSLWQGALQELPRPVSRPFGALRDGFSVGISDAQAAALLADLIPVEDEALRLVDLELEKPAATPTPATDATEGVKPDPVLDEIDLKILKALANHNHAVKTVDLAMTVGHDRDTCAEHVKRLIDLNYAARKSTRSGVAITEQGSTRLNRGNAKPS